jgi:hypothetical protein
VSRTARLTQELREEPRGSHLVRSRLKLMHPATIQARDGRKETAAHPYIVLPPVLPDPHEHVFERHCLGMRVIFSSC